ncbi:helix-turn-helix domain-containing protein [Streptomyces sp. NPDC053048]|uniref:helix-turn-helix domain-containing protein n=1 Tax=Streptomyces sp. NPDC053048 TaxID=3365694 RepID=UPI0037D63684
MSVPHTVPHLVPHTVPNAVPNAVPHIGVCPMCAGEVRQTGGPGRKKVYCGPPCRRRAQRIRDGQALPPRAHSSRPLGLRIAEDLQLNAAQLLEAEHAGRDLAVLLRLAGELLKQVEYYQAAAVQDARNAGANWKRVGDAASVSETTARQRWNEREVRRRLQRRDAERATAAAGRADLPCPRVPDATACAGPPGLPPDEASVDHAARKLAAALAHLHALSGLTIRDVALANGLSPSYVSRILAGERMPAWPVVHTLAEAFGGDPADLRVLWEAAHGLGPAPRDSISAAADRLRAALRGLYLAAGRPGHAHIRNASSGRLTHHVIQDLLEGEGVPDWASTSLLVTALDGRPADIRPLWEAFHYGFLATVDTPAGAADSPPAATGG